VIIPREGNKMSVAVAPLELPKKPAYKTGLAHWMEQVLEECDRAAVDFAPDPVHDLRVALRRCRSMADGWIAIDPDPAWKDMKKAGRKLFRALGELRDVQVMTEWVEKLAGADDSVGSALAAYAGARERELKQDALLALQSFDRKAWLRWGDVLPRRAVRVKLGSSLFLHMALERWMEARRLHGQALRGRTKISWHRLRIGIKRLRYTVENFLPELHDAWIGDLKEVQDWLGEVHDLDVLWDTALAQQVFADEAARERWRTRIAEERAKRMEKYRAKMVGKDALWQVWRAGLPKREDIRKAAMERLKLWASLCDPDFPHARRVAAHAVRIYDALAKSAAIAENAQDSRTVLQIAALMHEVGRVKGGKDHHKRGARMMRKLMAPVGVEAQELSLAAIVARYHRGALPQKKHQAFAKLPTTEQKKLMILAGILRLACALDADHRGLIRQISAAQENGHITISAQGYTPLGPLGERVAGARHLLEVATGEAVLVHGIKATGISRLRNPLAMLDGGTKWISDSGRSRTPAAQRRDVKARLGSAGK
jgi:CHAD domain-containing protein